jgi:hypothetical protein
MTHAKKHAKKQLENGRGMHDRLGSTPPWPMPGLQVARGLFVLPTVLWQWLPTFDDHLPRFNSPLPSPPSSRIGDILTKFVNVCM